MDKFIRILKHNRSIILYIALALISINLYDAWKKDYPPVAQQIATTEKPTTATAIPDAPATPLKTSSTEAALPALPAAATTPLKHTQLTDKPITKSIHVKTDVLDLNISTTGGTITSVYLNAYPISLGADEKYQLLGTKHQTSFTLQSGIIAKNQQTAPTHLATFDSSQMDYRLAEGKDKLVVDLVWQNQSIGIHVIKRYTFSRGSYSIKFEQIVNNDSDQAWQGWAYQQLERTPPLASGSMLDGTAYTFTGGAYYKPDTKYQKINFDEIKNEPINFEVQHGWVAFIQHYFVSAIIPEATENTLLFSKGLADERYLMGVRLPVLNVESGQTGVAKTTIYIGPKLQDHLEKVAPGLELTVDYGWLSVIAQPLFWLLSKIHSFVGNWGFAIIILTLMLKGLFFKLSEMSYRSMANLRLMTPRIQALKDRYGDDRQRMNQAMMELYKTEKINPLGGCLPMLVQIPVFIALYWMLMETVELRQAPFILWIQDLSVKDPLFILPLLMGASMFFQQKLNPAPPDPIQAKMMQMLPIIFTGLFAFFPAGLVLYWFVNNIASIAQQWYITRQIENESKLTTKK